MDKPIRIQRKRTKGWKMPKDAVYIGRPSKYGNPYKIIGDMVYGDASNRRGLILSPWVHINLSHLKNPVDLKSVVVDLYKKWLNGDNPYYLVPPPTKEDLKKLKGKDLACWCKESEKCHGDVLLKICNK